METKRVQRADLVEESRKLHRSGKAIRLVEPVEDGDDCVLHFEQALEVRVEQPDTSGAAARRVDL